MGGAFATAVCKAVGSDNVILSNRTFEKAEKLAAKLGCRAVSVNEVVENADFIFLGVKPQMMKDLADEIRETLFDRSTECVLVSMAAGLSSEDIRNLFCVKDTISKNRPIIITSPNTPIAVGEGIVFYSYTDIVSEDSKTEFEKAISACGLVNEIPEKLHAIGGTLSGCGPAFVDMFVEALADGAVACGLPRKTALEVAAQMIVGSGKLLLASGKHPGELKDAVCSPGGTTIQGVRTLEKEGFRAAAMDAVIAAYVKNLSLKK